MRPRRAANPTSAAIDRRDFLYGLGRSLGSVALSDARQGDGGTPRSRAARAEAGTLPAKAKACIFLMMEGGPSHIDTFDPKPKLAELHLKEFVRERTRSQSAMSSGKRYYVAEPVPVPQGGRVRRRTWPRTGSIWPASPTSCASTAAARSSRSTIRPRCTR